MKPILRNIIEEKCPKCGESHAFYSKGNVLLFKAPKMNERCTHCNYRYEKEPGYFTGAMYISYALCIIEMLLVVVLGNFADISIKHIGYLLMLLIFALWPFNFRMSRILWMYIA
ncbi:DUF983 domain-containing protein [Chondrinema litorale]|uniref:DUF983 domain-containing protein n=1 Tax=Chondrinema litorale TaxID=2994555 RepID=UPI0025429964|nr:DUF983 domain-containing protein [Chondrinema litorale]UZR96629.1 DUF983 domain-containing protein [Chondrinema litorale]